MTTNIIEINDSEIRVAQKEKIVLRSPGVAVVDGENIMLGNNALQQAYLHPRKTYNRFWSKLNQDALQNPTDNYRHHADLAYAHLINIHSEAGNPEELIFAVPGNLSNQQLSLLLGIVESCPFKAVGLVDIAVATAAAVADSGRYVHADIHLYQTVMTSLDIDTDVNRTNVEIIDDTGINTILNKVSSLISDLFIKQSRFDPLHHAETEQAIHDQLPVCLNTLLDKKEVLLEIPYNNTNHQAKLSREHLVQGLKGIYQRIVNEIPASTTVLVSDRLAALPGFVEYLAENHTLRPEDVFSGCLRNELKIRSKGDGLDFITSLPAAKNPSVSAATFVPPPPANVEPTNTPGHMPSHILDVHQAWSIGHGDLYLSSQSEPSTTHSDTSYGVIKKIDDQITLVANGTGTVLLNNVPIEGQARVSVGDTITNSNDEKKYLFITAN